MSEDCACNTGGIVECSKHFVPKIDSKGKSLSSDEIHSLVVKTSYEIHGILDKAVEKLLPKQKWLVRSRIVSLVFQNHFKLSMNAADKAIIDAEFAAKHDNVKGD